MQHALFPEHEEDARDLGFIRVWRQDKEGARFCAPAHFGPDELVDVEQLFEAFGGGRYEVVAHEPNGKIIARHRYAFEGQPKPLAGTGAAETAPRPATVAAVDPNAGNPWALMLGIMQMAMQMQAEQSRQTTQMMMALLTKGESNANQHVATMAQIQSQFSQTQAMLLKEAISQRAQPAGGDVSAAFLKGLEVAREIQRDGDSGEGDGELDGLIGSALEFMAGMQSGKAAPPQSVQPPTTSEDES